MLCSTQGQLWHLIEGIRLAVGKTRCLHSTERGLDKIRGREDVAVAIYRNTMTLWLLIPTWLHLGRERETISRILHWLNMTCLLPILMFNSQINSTIWATVRATSTWESAKYHQLNSRKSMRKIHWKAKSLLSHLTSIYTKFFVSTSNMQAFVTRYSHLMRLISSGSKIASCRLAMERFTQMISHVKAES